MHLISWELKKDISNLFLFGCNETAIDNNPLNPFTLQILTDAGRSLSSLSQQSQKIHFNLLYLFNSRWISSLQNKMADIGIICIVLSIKCTAMDSIQYYCKYSSKVCIHTSHEQYWSYVVCSSHFYWFFE